MSNAPERRHDLSLCQVGRHQWTDAALYDPGPVLAPLVGFYPVRQDVLLAPRGPIGHKEYQHLFSRVSGVKLCEVLGALKCILWDKRGQQIISVAEYRTCT